jgi:N-acetylmuramoyl-L-alanine amidase
VRLARGGVGLWTEPALLSGGPLFAHEEEGPPARALQAMLALYGYDVEITGVYDRQTRQVVAAFQRHFRPERVDGEADASTVATLKALIQALERK